MDNTGTEDSGGGRGLRRQVTKPSQRQVTLGSVKTPLSLYSLVNICPGVLRWKTGIPVFGFGHHIQYHIYVGS